MGESALWSQVQGEGHKKQEKVMYGTFVNFLQVKTETATTAKYFGFKRVYFNIIWQKSSVFNPKIFTGCGTNA